VGVGIPGKDLELPPNAVEGLFPAGMEIDALQSLPGALILEIFHQKNFADTPPSEDLQYFITLE
jgi:hypothetical protein